MLRRFPQLLLLSAVAVLNRARNLDLAFSFFNVFRTNGLLTYQLFMYRIPFCSWFHFQFDCSCTLFLSLHFSISLVFLRTVPYSSPWIFPFFII